MSRTKYYLAGAVSVSVIIILVLAQSQFGQVNQSKSTAGSNGTLAGINSTGKMTHGVNQVNQSKSTAGSNGTLAGINSTNNITHLYSSAAGGREWYANWFTPAHKIYSGGFDPYDPQFQARGNGYVTINGDGTANVTGTAPRMYVYDPTLQKKWNNVEITIYAKRVSDTYYSPQGVTAGARSGTHNDVTYPNICEDNSGYPNSAYNGRLTYDGRTDYVKEILYHYADAVSNDHSGASPKTVATFQNLTTPINNSTGFHTFPYHTWIGYKFVVRNMNNNSAVKMETWMDLTDGANGGTWTKLNEYIDKGGWAATYFYHPNNPWPCPTVPKDYTIIHAMPYVFVRADYVNEIDYKKFSIREINPLP